ncbi:alanine racemase [Spongiimicrobium sp. 3-5]|uniref:alanine racemase n=1 Tax=Spongiimicrobium sp. 3-5 TaxID=3332596 RepID=UPI00398131C2
MKNWYDIENIEDVDSPSIVLYEENLMYNLHEILAMAGGEVSMLMPHVKTNKMPKVIGLMISLGVKNFKASTIAEAEIAAKEGADGVLIAHQLVGPKIKRFGALTKRFPNTCFTTIIDNLDSAKRMNDEAIEQNVIIGIYIDINSGMNRSGIELGLQLDELIIQINNLNNLNLSGLHVYDGHLRDPDFQKRKDQIESGLQPITVLFQTLKKANPNLHLICGGTPSFTSHIHEADRISSPGTCLFWDWGYNEKLTEQDFKYAALLICRVISKPTAGIVTIDLGHKSVASENPIHQRVKFLNLDDYQLLSQSEEHGVLKVANWEQLSVGDVFYGVPYHICPTINLHDEVSVIRNNKKMDTWNITARRRKISV